MPRRPSRVTMKDIARELNVTVTTVSRALDDKPDIAPATKRRVLDAARRSGYVKSALGRGLATGYVRAVGCVLTAFTDPFVGCVLEGIEDVAREAGFALIIASSQASEEHEIKAIDDFDAYKVAAIIVLGSRVQQLHMARLMSLRSPTVLINSEDLRSYARSVRIDHVAAAKKAVAHLVALGHRRIAHISVAEESTTQSQRYLGYRQALEEQGLSYDPTLCVRVEDSERGGAEGARALLQLELRPTALSCFDDRIAIGAISALNQAGLSVPHDMSVIGIDDIPVAAWLSPPLTTVRQPLRETGQKAMEMALRLLAGEETGEIVLESELIVRGSTAAPPDNTLVAR